MQLEHESKFKYLRCVLDESDIDGAVYCRKVMNERKAVNAIRSLVNGMSLQLGSTRVLHEASLLFALLYGHKTMVWREKERSTIRALGFAEGQPWRSVGY